MQDIGQAPLAAAGRQQVFGNAPRGHQRPQHRHHAALPPDLPVAAKLFYQLIPRPFALVEVFNVLRVEAEHCGRQRAAQGIFPLGGQHRLQHPQQLLRLGGFKHAIAVGEIDGGNRQQLEGIAN